MHNASLSDLYSTFPHLLQILPFDHLLAFIIISRHLKQRIAMGSSCLLIGPPASLTRSVHGFICRCLLLDHEVAKMCWLSFRNFIWETSNMVGQAEVYLELFIEHGREFEIGTSHLLICRRSSLMVI
ncbi:hypothetical protein SCHPADRAFT_840184 [Schizopora paradoxa]|uniref:Uncharacterized protein n=1 Tax=Schizopora paradoxa TaxID=27342 RepID=A0A0H2QZI2_9AGAM|nr:hypothetical protein SCHPADRAFT_840184 [Schizopora paradoxa]